MKHSAKKTILVLAAVLVCGQSMLTSCVEDIFDNPCHVIIPPIHTKKVKWDVFGTHKIWKGTFFILFLQRKSKKLKIPCSIMGFSAF